MIEIRSAEYVGGASSLSALPSDRLPEVAFAGRSNVGKSSLINMLLGRRNLARTSGKPGKTQTITFYLVNESFHVVDLPGLGYARVSQARRRSWRSLIAGYLAGRDALRLLFHLIDSRHPPMTADLELTELYRGTGVPVVVLLTKADKLSRSRRADAARQTREAFLEMGLELPVVLTSSTGAMGRDRVLEWIEDVALPSRGSSGANFR